MRRGRRHRQGWHGDCNFIWDMRSILLIVSLLVLGGGPSDALTNSVAVGNTREEVIAALGEPQGALRDASSEILNYKNCDIKLVLGRVVQVNNLGGPVKNTTARPRTSLSASMPRPSTVTPSPPPSTAAPAVPMPGDSSSGNANGVKSSQFIQWISSRVTQHQGQPLTVMRRLVLYAGVALMLIGIMVASGAGIWLLVRAFQVHIGWGLACMFVPFANLVFLFRHWEEGRKPFLVSLGGALGSALGIFMALMIVGGAAVAAPAGAEQLPSGVIQAGSLANDILIRDAMTGVAAKIATLGCNQPQNVKHIYVVNLPEGQIGLQHWRERWIVAGCGREYTMDLVFQQDGHHSASYTVY